MTFTFQHRTVVWTTDKFIALLLALVIIYLLFNQVAKFVQKNLSSKAAKNFAVSLLLIAFMVVACVLLLLYVFK